MTYLEIVLRTTKSCSVTQTVRGACVGRRSGQTPVHADTSDSTAFDPIWPPCRVCIWPVGSPIFTVPFIWNECKQAAKHGARPTEHRGPSI